MRMITISLVLLIFVSACTVGNQEIADTTNEVVLDETVNAEMAKEDAEVETFASNAQADSTEAPETENTTTESEAEVEATDIPTQTPEPTAVACNYRTDWEVYRIRGGDTIWELSQATNTSLDVLMQANCQTDHILTVGQYFYLPFIPDGFND